MHSEHICSGHAEAFAQCIFSYHCVKHQLRKSHLYGGEILDLDNEQFIDMDKYILSTFAQDILRHLLSAHLVIIALSIN